MPTERVRYEQLGPIEKHEPTCDDYSNVAGPPSSMRPIYTRKQVVVLLSGNIVLFLISICVLMLAISQTPTLSQLECAKKVSAYCELIFFNVPHHSLLNNTYLTFCNTSVQLLLGAP